jgi:arylsulfatase A-like enzyme
LAKAEKPFFVHLCYTASHFPLHAFPEDIARYRGKYSDGYLAMHKRRHKRQAELGLFPSLPKLSAPENKKGDLRKEHR